jgi:hypothetical protein
MTLVAAFISLLKLIAEKLSEKRKLGQEKKAEEEQIE